MDEIERPYVAAIVDGAIAILRFDSPAQDVPMCHALAEAITNCSTAWGSLCPLTASD